MSTQRTTVVVIGGGQAGLAVSRCLHDRSVEHVVLERGRIGERWRSERWDSLRLLTPNWQARLPGHRYEGPDAEGFMDMPQVIRFLTDYARSFAAPVQESTTVTSLSRGPEGFRIETDRGDWSASGVVIATGPFHLPRIPSTARSVPGSISQLSTSTYRRPSQLSDGPVLVVGASASGVQIAHELRMSGREVILAVGSHTFLPRRYRGLDIQWWLEQLGALDGLPDAPRSGRSMRHEHSLQLVGDDDGRSLGLRHLHELGVEITGRLVDLGPRAASFADDLATSCADSSRRHDHVLARIDAFVAGTGLTAEVDAPDPEPPFVPGRTIERIDLRSGRVSSIVWAAGHRRTYPWLHVPVLDSSGEICHRGGITPEPGLYAVGLPLMRSRKSTFIDGVGRDAEAIVEHLTARLARREIIRSHH